MSTPLYGTGDTEREFDEGGEPVAYRSGYVRDYGRVIHSGSFRRLQGKTQVFPVHESDFFRNRLTHSLEVAQIAECIAARLNYENTFFEADKIDERARRQRCFTTLAIRRSATTVSVPLTIKCEDTVGSSEMPRPFESCLVSKRRCRARRRSPPG